LGVLDYAVYAFGYRLAGLTHKDAEAVQVLFEWIRIPVVVIGLAALHRVFRPTRAG